MTGLSRKEASGSGMITSIGTKRIVGQSLKNYFEWRIYNNLPLEQQDNRVQLVAYLGERAEYVRQATLNQNRNSLMIAYGIKLPLLRAELGTVLSRRSYTHAEVESVIQHQTHKNSLATLISLYAGLRAHELATLRRLDELPPSPHREWDARLFAGLEGVAFFVVVGKGGLRRRVAVPLNLVNLLEARRLSQPQRVTDRGIFYQRYYDVGFGQAFSQSFSAASKKAMGFSRGAHGLRHSYTKNRTRTLRSLGFSQIAAQRIVSQELGHFRPDITLAYYR